MLIILVLIFCNSNVYTTYTCNETLDPEWDDQIFMFDVPVQATASLRGHYLRVTVKSKSVFGSDSFLGQVDLQLARLLDEQSLCGWFPLKPLKYSIKASPESLQVTGSIKLNVQWVHSTQALADGLNYVIEK